MSCRGIGQTATVRAILRRKDRPGGEAGFRPAARFRDEGIAVNRDRELKRLPPTNALFIHPKIAGFYLLATRRGAGVAIRDPAEAWL